MVCVGASGGTTSCSAVTSGSANGLSLIGLLRVLVGDTDIVWEIGGDVACGILRFMAIGEYRIV